MSQEYQIQQSLIIRSPTAQGVILHRTATPAFSDDAVSAIGPWPGTVLASVVGTDVDFATGPLVNPYWCEFSNLDPANYVDIGMWDDANDIFHPMLELRANKTIVVPLSRWLGKEFGTGPGTGTTAGASKLRIRANSAPVYVSMKAFDE